MSHHVRLFYFIFLVETGFHRVSQGGLELLTSGNLPALASQGSGITGVSHRARLTWINSFEKVETHIQNKKTEHVVTTGLI